MALTPEEAQELAELRRRRRERELEEEGNNAVTTARPRQVEQGLVERGVSFLRDDTRDFSLGRVVMGSVKDTIEDAGNLLLDLTGGFSSQQLLANPVVGGLAFGLGAISEGVGQGEITTTPEGDPKFSLGGPLKGEEDAGAVETFTREVGSYIAPFSLAAKAIGGLRAATTLGRMGKAAAAGFIADFATQDTDEGNFANLVRDTFGLDNAMLDSLAAEEDDGELEARLKAAVSAVPVGIAFDSFIEMGTKAVKAYRAWKGTAAEANATIEALERDYSLTAPDLSEGSTVGAAKTSTKKVPHPGYVFAKELADSQPQTYEDVVTFLKRVSETDLSEDDLGRFATDILTGDHKGLSQRLGIDPKTLDFSVFDDPARMAAIHADLVDVMKTVARKLGRTGIRVSEASTIAAARTLATNDGVLRNLYRKVKDLPEIVAASDLIVRSHAERLMSLADAAVEEIKTGTAGTAWEAYKEALHRHAYFVGAFRGSASEVGRALRALRTTKAFFAKRAAAEVKKGLDEAGFGSDRKAISETGGKDLQEDFDGYITTLRSDADKLEHLARTISHRGDVGDLSRMVRMTNESRLQRAEATWRETVGNYFGISTAWLNIMGGFSLYGARALAKMLVILDKMTIIRKDAKARQDLIRAQMDLWAYVDGITTAFTEANSNVINLLKREFGGEALLQAQALDGSKIAKLFNLDNISKKAAEVVAEGTRAAAKANYERADVVNQRRIALSPEVQQRYLEKAAQLKGPAFFGEALKAMVRMTSSAVALAGTATRAGTILAINAPDQWAGTLFARAGAQSTAVRLAAQDGVARGLEGDKLVDYIQARMVQLTQDWDGIATQDAFLEGARPVVAAHGDAEARAMLFQDTIETPGLQQLAWGINKIPFIGSALAPFVITPMRIIERSVYEYTPIGVFNSRIRKAIAAGGPEGDEAIARLGLGVLTFAAAWKLAEAGGVVGNDGGYQGSGRLARPSYSIEVGDDQVAYQDLVPFGLLVGMAADMQRYMDQHADDPQAQDEVENAIGATISAIAANVLSRTWLTQISMLTDAIRQATRDDGDATGAARKFVGSVFARMIPGAGLQKSMQKWDDPYIREARTITDALVRNTAFSDDLPIKLDALGNPIDYEGLERAGFPISPVETDEAEAELARLGFNLPRTAWTQLGVRLTAEQMNRLLTIRGHEVKKPIGGRKMTLNEAIKELVAHPAYKALPSDLAKVEEVRWVMEGYTPLAVDQLIREDKSFAAQVVEKETWTNVQREGGSIPERKEATNQAADLYGLREYLEQ